MKRLFETAECEAVRIISKQQLGFNIDGHKE